MKCLVTGGCGFIGSHLADRLIKDGYKVVVVDDLSTGKREYLNPKAEFYQVSCQQDDVALVFEAEKPEVVFHLAALARIQRSLDEPILTHEANVNGTLKMLECSKTYKVKRFIYSSSSSVYGDQAELPLDINLNPCPISPYAAQKYMGELYCQQYSKHFKLPTTILRYFNVYGPRQTMEGPYKLVIGIFLQQKKEGKPLTVFGDGKQTRDFTYIDDVVEANIKAMECKSDLMGIPVNIGSGKETSINKIARLVGGKAKHIKPNPRAEFEEERKYADVGWSEYILNWKPKVFIKEGIERTKEALNELG